MPFFQKKEYMKNLLLLALLFVSTIAFSQISEHSRFDWSSQIAEDTTGVTNGKVFAKVDDGFEWINAAYQTYTSNEATIKASGPGITFNISGGVGVLTIPDGVDPVGFSVKVEDSDLDANGNFTVVIDNQGAVNYNNSYADMYVPSMQIIQTASLQFGGPSDSFPFIVDEGSSPQRQVTAVGGGDISMRLINADQFMKFIANFKF